ncbi:MAG: YebC/PmpR family DNA-binding transcriptional regulator [Candidatus Dadabacteria bacterium]|nr:MAG: YebC/PmpR family DNA-binding transcriptional regulator [Candidatus Dadabacteria bacterium]
MAGHSKWANIKHKKAREDAKRGKIFSKLAKEITVAAKLGGGDPDGNPRLRRAIETARSFNMPKDNIERAIKKGTGEGGGADYEQITYEGYGPGGVAVLVEVLTDNRNRTVGEIRHAFSKNKGNLGENGCVAWLFESKAYFTVPKAAAGEEQLLEVALEAGAEDVRDGGEVWEVLADPDAYEDVRAGLEAAGLELESSEVTMLPKNTVKLQGADAERMLRLMEMLEDNDDVQNVYANFDIDDAEMERIAGG